MTFITLAAITAEAITYHRTPIVTFGYIIQVIISLAIVLGLIYVSSKFLLPKLKFSPHGRSIEVVERIGLEPGLSVYVIKRNNTKYFLAVSQKNAVLLDKFEEGELP